MKVKLQLTIFGLAALLTTANYCLPQTPHVAPPPHNSYRTAKEASAPSARPKLIVVLVVDQMRGDYVDKFKGQWTGGLKRLLAERACFLQPASPYAPTV